MLTLRRDSSMADSSALSLSFFRKPWNKRHGMEVKRTATYFPLFCMQSTRPLFLSLSFPPYFLQDANATGQRLRIVIIIENAVINVLRIDPVRDRSPKMAALDWSELDQQSWNYVFECTKSTAHLRNPTFMRTREPRSYTKKSMDGYGKCGSNVWFPSTSHSQTTL